MPCRRNPADRSELGATRRASRPGALLFGYFLLGKQEKVTRSPAGERKALPRTKKAKIKMDSRFRGNDGEDLDSRFRGNDERETRSELPQRRRHRQPSRP